MRKRNRTITIRCTEEEYERIHNKAQRNKLSLSDFVLKSALDKKIVVVDGLNEVSKQQKAIGRNLNQIAMLAHEGRLHSVRLDELIEQHRSVTAAVCEIAKGVK
ncbi:plasmid mobilization protein [Ruminococcus flavefaciens]|uniref:plasmid mobilization protein n=1 Tax=Ruminococcus flavefaciens TaxID=1265 RepID=UPI0026F31A86|nr:plasmid mobilization relaxosome protein MobC [Ruminococcus flavefaciens]MDD7516356.1 plasmid mobilization relaxosome protein MobC [Ruminococcus flavefaciens]MDY5691940.1 plasmid mobilization relaxosome protein MobC [Ruminococcus flavefaciens]